MYKFIFYGVYRTMQHTVISKKEEDVRNSAVVLMAATAFVNIITIMFVTLKIITNQLDILDYFDKNLQSIILIILLAAYNYFFCYKKLDVISEKYAPLYDKHEYLDRIIGFGYPIASFIIAGVIISMLR